uniref:SLD5_C domain-containing protein n=1 Tax=Heterorhabditis bacteriophora TaxID=37862 RepID=A0A1I7X7M3_HETBA
MMEDSDPISREDVSIPSKITQPLQQYVFSVYSQIFLPLQILYTERESFIFRLEDTYLTSKALSDKNNEEIDAVDGRFILKKTPGQMVQVRDDQVMYVVSLLIYSPS